MATSDTTEYIDYPYIKSEALEKRQYQTDLADAALSESSLICLPTGMGKTPVAAMVAANRLNENSDLSGKRVLMLAPTKPLVEQHIENFREWMDIPDHEIKMFTGDTRPSARESLWDEPASVVIATPQVIENDLVSGRIDLENVVYLVFDECHRATGDYAYNYIAERYWQQAARPLVTGMSASPGSEEETILEVCENLGLTRVEVVTEDDESLDEYTFETEYDVRKVELDGKYAEIDELLSEPYTEVLKELKDDLGVLNTRDKRRISYNTIKAARGKASDLIDKEDSAGYRAMSLLSEVQRFNEATTAVETQGMEELLRKFDTWEQQADMGESKAVQRFMKRSNVKEARRLAEETDEPHPKMKELRPAVARTLIEGGQALVFTESRLMAERMANFLCNDQINAHRFVGQADTETQDGMSQQQQSEVLQRFRNGAIDVLVATSVAEEGLDIPNVDLVAIYNPSGTSVRNIQRTGRTGRQSQGSVVMLMTRNSRDEGAYYSAMRQQEQMEEDLKKLKDMEGELNQTLGAAQAELSEFSSAAEVSEEDVEPVKSADEVDTGDEDVEVEDRGFDESDEDNIVIYADTREQKSSIVKELSKIPEVDLRIEQLEVGDFIVSDRCAIERKSAQDFKDTLTGGDRNLFEQLGEMRSAYERPILLLEGEVEDFFGRGIHPNAIRGTMAAVILGMNTSPLHTRSEEDTVQYLLALARREQEERDREVSAHGSKSTKSKAEQQEYIVSSIIDVGPVTAKSLLNEFGSVRAVMNASRQELMSVENIGESTADRILDTITSEYQG